MNKHANTATPNKLKQRQISSVFPTSKHGQKSSANDHDTSIHLHTQSSTDLKKRNVQAQDILTSSSTTTLTPTKRAATPKKTKPKSASETQSVVATTAAAGKKTKLGKRTTTEATKAATMQATMVKPSQETFCLQIEQKIAGKKRKLKEQANEDSKKTKKSHKTPPPIEEEVKSEVIPVPALFQAQVPPPLALNVSNRTLSLINKARKKDVKPSTTAVDQISIGHLLNSDSPAYIQTPPDSESASPKTSPIAPPVVVKKQLPVVGSQTMQLLTQLRKKGTTQSSVPMVSHLLANSNKLRQDLSLKHQELLKPQPELVLPLKFKHLISALSNLDQSICFLKHTRNSNLFFKEVCDSVKSTFGRDMSLQLFTQLLQIVPEYYRYGYTQQGKMWIDSTQNLRNDQVMYQRKEGLKSKLLTKCKERFLRWCTEQGIQSQEYLDGKVWHHNFDPHSIIEDIPEAILIQPSVSKAESLHNFVSKQNSQKDQTPQVASDQPASNKLQELSSRTGISLDTLRLVKHVERQQNDRKAIVNNSVQKIDPRRKQEQLVMIANQIRQVMLFRQTSTMRFQELLSAISSTSEYLSEQLRGQLVTELSQMVPEWITVKEFSGKGKIIKLTSSCNQYFVSQQITQRCQENSPTKATDQL